MKKCACLFLLLGAALSLGAVLHKIGEYLAPGDTGPIVLCGELAYLGQGGGLQVLDISDPTQPECVDSLVTPMPLSELLVSGNRLYATGSEFDPYNVCYNSHLYIFNISQPQDPVLTGFCPLPGLAGAVSVAGNLAYVLCSDIDYQTAMEYFWITVLDVADPTAPVQVNFHLLSDPSFDLRAEGSTLYLAQHTGLRVFSAADPQHLSYLGSYDLPYGASSLAVDCDIACLAGSDLWFLDVSNPQNPALLGSLPAVYASDITHWGTSAYLVTNRGLLAVDASDPANPVPSGEFARYAGYIAVYEGLACLTHGQTGVHLLDVSEPGNPAQLGSLDTSGTAGDVAVSGSTAFLADGGQGLLAVDISVPEALIPLGAYNPGGTLNALKIVGNRAYLAYGAWDEDWHGLRIADAANPASLLPLGQLATQDMAQDVDVEGNYAYVTDNFYGLKIIDVTVPSQPVLTASLPSSGYTKLVAVNDGLACTAGYNGFRVVDVSDPQNPVQIGFCAVGFAQDLALAPSTVYVADLRLGLLIIDVSVPSQPAIVTAILPHPGSLIQRCCVRGNRLLVSDTGWNEIRIYDITEPQAPALVQRYAWNLPSFGLGAEGNLLYTANDSYGLYVHDLNLVAGDDPALPQPDGLKLSNRPNPFNPSTQLDFTLPASGLVRLDIFNLRGQLVATLLDEQFTAGNHSVAWDGRDSQGRNLTSGVYLARLHSEARTTTHKLLLLK